MIEDEAKELSQSTFGGTLLHTIGFIYKEEAKKHKNFGSSTITTANQKLRTIKNYGKATTSVAKSLYVASKFLKKEKKQMKNDMTEEEKINNFTKNAEEMTSQNLNTFIKTLWNFTVIDIESTLRKVCKKVLTDHSVSKNDRDNRLFAL